MSKGLTRSLKDLYTQLGSNQVLTGPGAVDAGVTTTVVATEMGNDAVRRTRLTLTNVPVTVISITTGAGVGGTELYTFPEGYIQKLGAISNLSISIATAKEADFTDSTAEGDIGLGTLAPANADSLGTDSTDDDFGTATAFVMASFTDSAVALPSEVSALLNGSTTPIPLFINVLVDAADIDDSITTEVLISGTVDIVWSLIGDV